MIKHAARGCLLSPRAQSIIVVVVAVVVIAIAIVASARGGDDPQGRDGN